MLKNLVRAERHWEEEYVADDARSVDEVVLPVDVDEDGRQQEDRVPLLRVNAH